MHGKRIRSLLFVVIAAVFLSACGSNEKRAAEPGPVVTGVQTETVRLESAPLLYQAVGTVRSANTAVLAAQMAGTVARFACRPATASGAANFSPCSTTAARGRRCKGAEAGVNEAIQGEAEVEQALKAATADRQFAEATFNRYKGLLAKNSLSRQEYDGAEARYKAALANERALEAKKQQIAGSPAAGALAAGFRPNLPQLFPHRFAHRWRRDREIRGCGDSGDARHAAADGGRHGSLPSGSEPAGRISRPASRPARAFPSRRGRPIPGARRRGRAGGRYRQPHVSGEDRPSPRLRLPFR